MEDLWGECLDRKFKVTEVGKSLICSRRKRRPVWLNTVVREKGKMKSGRRPNHIGLAGLSKGLGFLV